MDLDANVLSRAQGCLLGQLAGDALGSLVEFRSPEQIRRDYPEGVREIADGGTWGTIAGQPTDDSEMALALARTLIKHGGYDPGEARKAYVSWLNSGPFDCGNTVASGLQGRLNRESQANGALMRISPIGIFGASHEISQVSAWAQQDAALTHPHPICLQANALFATAVAKAVRKGEEASEIYEQVKQWAWEARVEAALIDAILKAATSPPTDYVHQQGWVLIAIQNALWQLVHAPSVEDGVVDTVMRGGDTDTNAAIAGALLGAVHGLSAIPARWRNTVLDCRPEAGRAGVLRPRPEFFWPVDALEIARGLVAGSAGESGH